MRKLFKAVTAGVLAFSMLPLSGCAAQRKANEKTWKIAVMSKSSSSYWTPVWTACDHAEEEMNVEIVRYSPEKTDIDIQLPMLEQVVNTDVDAIVLAAVDPELENQALATANARGIQIVTYDSDVNYEGRRAYVGTQNTTAGTTAAGYASRVLNGEGKIGIIYHEEAGTAILRRDGFINELTAGTEPQSLPSGAGSKQNNFEPELDEEGNPIETIPEETVPQNTAKYPGIQVVNSVLGESDADISREKAKELILNDHVDLIFSTNQKGGQGACEAVAELVADGSIQEGQVHVLCIDYFRSDKGDASDYINQGILSAVFLQNPYNMAYIGIKYARDLLEGNNVEPSLDTGATLLTSDNINEDAVQFLISQSY